MKMGTNPIVLIFFCGQLWCTPLSAEVKRPSYSSLPATFQAPTTVSIDLATQPFRDRDNVKNQGPLVSTAAPTVTEAHENKPHDGHIIGAVVIGIILMAMIVVIVGIFLWKRLRRTGPVDPHWAGRSPFADGDVMEITADKETVQSSKRTSVLSLLPWKFNKDTLLLDNVEGQLSEPGQGLDDPPADGAEKSDSQSSRTVTENSILSTTSLQTPISDGPGSLTDIPLQSDDLLPELANLPPPPSWTGEVSEDLCPNGTEPFPLKSPAETLCSAPPDFPCENPDEASSLPPPPEDFLSPDSMANFTGPVPKPLQN